jgi:hypothetical protein
MHNNNSALFRTKNTNNLLELFSSQHNVNNRSLLIGSKIIPNREIAIQAKKRQLFILIYLK